MSERINEDYVRGFFDGKGCVSVKYKLLVLSNTDKKLIDEIRDFLESLTIKTHLFIRKPPKEHHKVCYDIRIHDYYSIKTFYRLIGAKTHIKKQKIIELIDSYVKIPLSETEKRKIVEMCESGYTYRYVADFLGRSVGTVYRIYKKHTHSTDRARSQ